jgi:trehalose-phosphatase
MSSALSRGADARAVFTRLVESEAPLLFLDLDGTLAPLVAISGAARVPAFTRRAIRDLRRSGAQVVLISGRSIDGVLPVAAMPVDAILGDHGACALIAGRRTPWIPAATARLTRAARAVAPLIDATPGLSLERKERSIAVHVRLPGRHRNPAAREVARRFRAAGLRVLPGRQVMDVQLPGVNKGVAVLKWLARRPADTVLYAGDDTTDKDAFRALRGRAIVIGVGPRARSAAFRTRDPLTFAAWLARLAAARRRRHRAS